MKHQLVLDTSAKATQKHKLVFNCTNCPTSYEATSLDNAYKIADKVTCTRFKYQWEDSFNNLINNYPNNLEITHGEIVDGNLGPLKLFIYSIELESRRNEKQRIKTIIENMGYITDGEDPHGEFEYIQRDELLKKLE